MSSQDGRRSQVANGVGAFTEVVGDTVGLPAKASGNVVDGKTSGCKGYGSGYTVGMGDNRVYVLT